MVLAPTITKNVIVIKNNKAYYDASLNPLAGEHTILLKKEDVDSGDVKILNPKDRKTTLKIIFKK